MDIRPIRTLEDYDALDKYWYADLGTEGYDYFDVCDTRLLLKVVTQERR